MCQAGLIQERCGPVRETAEPSGIGGNVKQPVLPVLVGGQQGRAFERP